MTHTSFTISRKCLKSLEEKLSLQLHDYFKIFSYHSPIGTYLKDIKRYSNIPNWHVTKTFDEHIFIEHIVIVYFHIK